MISIDSDTLYYTFSTIPQVLAALIAVLAAFVHFKIVRLQEYIIGNAKSLYENWDKYDYWFKDNERGDRTKEQLADAINRKSIYDIEYVIFKIMFAESATYIGDIGKKMARSFNPDANITLTDLSNKRSIFKKTHRKIKKKIEDLKKRIIKVTKLAVYTIFISLLWLTFFDIIFVTIYTKIFALLGTFVLTVIILIFSYKIILLGVKDTAEGKKPLTLGLLANEEWKSDQHQ